MLWYIEVILPTITVSTYVAYQKEFSVLSLMGLFVSREFRCVKCGWYFSLQINRHWHLLDDSKNSLPRKY